MSTIYSHSDDHMLVGETNLKIKSFVKGDPSPFPDIDYSHSCVYELTDFTFRTPLEKMDVFNQLLEIPHPCEVWILPVTEETTALLEDMPKDETYEKTAALFSMLSNVKEKIEADRTFLITHKDYCSDIIQSLEKLGFTVTEKKKEELKTIDLS
ncbi:hypothetical protein D4T97_002860 [Siminovitchia acidinfaciens]|uniref:Uncharacterized protein n=1 Tax=Siminovitchia acidinfaciens TaxID=2321395 RepID=A0A429Y7N9_9BACI|nr:hypothetical protein [Siminovitchia acidinfaciens]RST77441.1 hypothetical protein D4T97_002860 [Siminovitchia acidinfaciens]VEF46866.1 Uncharacterised protein [Bacillus freudenreichii]